MKTSLLTLVLSAIWYYKNGNDFSFFKSLKADVDTSAHIPVMVAESLDRTDKKTKKIYLTFDDGPDKGTSKVLQIAASENIPVTFFIVGEHIEGSTWQKRIYDSLLNLSNVELANHSFSHALHNRFGKFYADANSVLADFNACKDSLPTSIARTPGRNIWRTESLRITDIKASMPAADTLFKAGYTLVGWDAEWFLTPDQRPVQSSEQMFNLVDSLFKHGRTHTKNHLVILTHDRSFARPQDSASLHQFIKRIKADSSYEFEWTRNYPGVKKDSAVLRN